VVTLMDTGVVISYAVNKDDLPSGEDLGFEPPVAIPFPVSTPTQLALQDMNGDGWVDIVVLDRGSSAVWLLINLGNRKFSEPYSFDTGTSPISMSITDVDADGCPDIVTADSQGRTLTSLRNTTNSCQK